MAPVLRPTFSLCADGVTETAVPGQIRTSPPRGKRSTVVSAPAVMDDAPCNVMVGVAASTIATGAGGGTAPASSTVVGCSGFAAIGLGPAWGATGVSFTDRLFP